MSETPAVVKVAQNLRRIEALHQRLREHAEAYAVTHPAGTDLPGGEAMAQLGPVGSFDRWSRRQYVTMEVEGGKPEPPDSAFGAVPVLQTLMFWSEMWREQHGQLWDTWLPTVGTEASWLRYMLQWAYDHEPHFEDFAEDVDDCRVKLENLLREGERAERGVPCVNPECPDKGTLLARKVVPGRGPDGKKIWRETDWHCPSCKQACTENQYRVSVRVMYEAQTEWPEVEYVDTPDGQEKWCTPDHAAARVKRSPKTVRTWRDRYRVGVACMWLREDRPEFVRFEDVEERHEDALARRAARDRRRESHRGNLVPESNPSSSHALMTEHGDPGETIRRVTNPEDYVMAENLRAG